MDIPLDLEIAVDVMSIHFDPELYGPQDPNEFHPERFAPECKRNPLAFLSFGVGPRNCIGKFNLFKILSLI
jgi:cytochrome P450